MFIVGSFKLVTVMELMGEKHETILLT